MCQKDLPRGELLIAREDFTVWKMADKLDDLRAKNHFTKTTKGRTVFHLKGQTKTAIEDFSNGFGFSCFRTKKQAFEFLTQFNSIYPGLRLTNSVKIYKCQIPKSALYRNGSIPTGYIGAGLSCMRTNRIRFIEEVSK